MEKEKISPLVKFFCRSAGAYIPILEELPSQIFKYQLLGIVIFITALFACLSGGYFLLTVFNNYTLALVFGLFWGFVIFSIDRFFVMSMSYIKTKKGKRWGFAGRLALALCLGVIVAKPLELKIFEKEILSQLSSDNITRSNNRLNSDTSLTNINNRIILLDQELDSLKSSVATAKKDREKYKTDFYAELNGTKGGISTEKRGNGPEAKKKKKIWDEATAEYKLIFNDYINRKEEVKNNKEELIAKRGYIEQKLNAPLESNDGPLYRLKALQNLIRGERDLYIANILLTFIFIFIEIAPVLLKMIMNRGVYDELFEMQEDFDKTKLIESKKFEKYKCQMEFKILESDYHGDLTNSLMLKNEIVKNQSSFEKEVVNKHQKISIESLNNNNFVVDKYSKLFKRIYPEIKN